MTKRDYAPESEWKNWSWRSEGDLMMNGAFFVQSGKNVENHPEDDVKPQSAEHVASLTRFTGPLKCEINKPC